MARGVNKAILIGNMGKDPELRYAQSGTAVCNFSLATTEQMKKDGEWQDHTEWHRLVAFGKTAENINQYMTKGSSMYVEGRIQTRKWTDKEGTDRYTTEIVANDVQFLGGRGEGQQGGGSYDNQGGGAQNTQPDQGFDPNDDVPF